LLSNGKQIIQTYRSSAGTELIPFMNNVASISIYAVQLFDSSGKPLLIEGAEPVVPDAERIRNVLAGGVTGDVENEGRYPMVGLPFSVDGKSYALIRHAQRTTNYGCSRTKKSTRSCLPSF